ncbi:50S ribosomal protein L24e [Haloarchaeobius amylolyticus]|uniref:Large ribosomal subunit protein eL24 n=1 Tax=Haloarchaeobius amylolyticus TaxID=1198296 RepID=A0ABD6BBQ5_9EURY
MVEKRTCDYTGEEIEPGTGIMYVKNDGTVLHFVDSKAEKNYKLGREPRDLEWTEEGRRAKGPAQEQTPAPEVDEDEAETEDEADVSTEDESDDVEAEEA